MSPFGLLVSIIAELPLMVLITLLFVFAELIKQKPKAARRTIMAIFALAGVGLLWVVYHSQGIGELLDYAAYLAAAFLGALVLIWAHAISPALGVVLAALACVAWIGIGIASYVTLGDVLNPLRLGLPLAVALYMGRRQQNV